MEINSIHIAAFGGLRDVTLDLSDGVNVYKAQNEYDKSAVILFIRILFHGIPDEQMLTSEVGAYPSFVPDGVPGFGGSVRFTVDGAPYLLNREFSREGSGSTFSIKNLSSGKIIDTGNLEPGEHLFGRGHSVLRGDVFATESHQRNIRLFEAKEMYRQTEKELADLEELILRQNEEEIEDGAREEVLERSMRDLVTSQESQIHDAKALLENKVRENRKLEESLLIMSGDLKSMLERRSKIRRLQTRVGTREIPARVFILFLAAFLVSLAALLISLLTSVMKRDPFIMGGFVFLLIDLAIFIANRVQLYRINRALIEKNAEYDSLMRFFDSSAAAQYDRETALSAEEKKRDELLLHRNRLRENFDKDVRFRRQIMNVSKAKKAVYEMKLAGLRESLDENVHGGLDKVPLLLDEAFIRYDDKKIGYKPEMIRELSKDRQVLIFTCDDHLARIFGPDGIDKG